MNVSFTSPIYPYKKWANVASPSAMKETFEKPFSVQSTFMGKVARRETFVSKTQVGLAEAYQAYAKPQITTFPKVAPKFGCADDDKKFDYADDSWRDIWLDDNPNHDEKWKQANRDANRILTAAQQQGLDPQTTAFMISSPEKLLQVAARGLPNLPNDWVYGQYLYDLAQNEALGLSHIYELVLNTKPAIGYLLNTNTPIETRLVIAHVYGHTDFFKRNAYFKDTRPEEILSIIGQHREELKGYVHDMTISRDPKTQRNPVREFVNKVHSIDMLIDLESETAPNGDFGVSHYIPPIHPESTEKKQIPPLDESDRYLYTPEEWAKKEKQYQEELTPRKKKFPLAMDRDILGFLAKHSSVLDPWQRRILQMKREQTYYFKSVMATKIMNEGWASFWHTKLLMEDPDTSLDHATEVAKLNHGVISPHKESLNPYWLGYSIWEDLYIKGGLGIPLTEEKPSDYQKYNMFSIREVPEFNQEKALAAVYTVCAKERDYTFVEKYLTPDLAEKLKLYTFDTEEQGWWYQRYNYSVIKSRKFEAVQKEILNGLRYLGQPMLEVIDADFEGGGELLLNHTYINEELNIADTKEVLKIIASMWGRPVYLDSYVSEKVAEVKPDPFGDDRNEDPRPPKEPKLVPIRYVVDPKEDDIEIYIREGREIVASATLNEDGTIDPKKK